MLEEMRNEEIPYEKWEVTGGAKDLLLQTEKRVEKAKKKNKIEIKLDYNMKFIENGYYRPLKDYERGHLLKLLKNNGYQLPAEISMVDGYARGKNKYGIEFREPPYITWFTEEEVNKQKNTTFIFFILAAIFMIVVMYLKLKSSM